MQYVRWYDKNPDLKEVFDFIENLSETHQNQIASDILQILMSDFNLDLDKEINQITQNYTFTCRRWYDKNIDLFTSFEIIRRLSDEMQESIIRKILQTALFIYIQEK